MKMQVIKNGFMIFMIKLLVRSVYNLKISLNSLVVKTFYNVNTGRYYLIIS